MLFVKTFMLPDSYNLNIQADWRGAAGGFADRETRKGRKDTTSTNFTSNFICSFDSKTVLTFVLGDAASTRSNLGFDINALMTSGVDRYRTCHFVHGAKRDWFLATLTTVVTTGFGLVSRGCGPVPNLSTSILTRAVSVSAIGNGNTVSRILGNLWPGADPINGLTAERQSWLTTAGMRWGPRFPWKTTKAVGDRIPRISSNSQVLGCLVTLVRNGSMTIPVGDGFDLRDVRWQWGHLVVGSTTGVLEIGGGFNHYEEHTRKRK